MIPGTLTMPVSGGIKNDYQIFASSGSWTAPAGVSTVFAVVIGAGGMGGRVVGGQSFIDGQGTQYYVIQYGGLGGKGGVAIGKVSVTPGTTYTVSIGSYGGSSSFSAAFPLISATGGANGTNAYDTASCSNDGNCSYTYYPGTNGANGSGSGGSIYNSNMSNQATVDSYITSNVLSSWDNPSVSTAEISALIADSATERNNGGYSTTWSSSNVFVPGASGQRQTTYPSNNQLAGMNGLCLLAWGGSI